MRTRGIERKCPTYTAQRCHIADIPSIWLDPQFGQDLACFLGRRRRAPPVPLPTRSPAHPLRCPPNSELLRNLQHPMCPFFSQAHLVVDDRIVPGLTGNELNEAAFCGLERKHLRTSRALSEPIRR